jgi:hypothetical protein
MWVWIAIGMGSFLGLSLLMGLALAGILGTIGRQISELQQTDDWTTLPPTRARQAVKEHEQQQPQEQAKPAAPSASAKSYQTLPRATGRQRP